MYYHDELYVRVMECPLADNSKKMSLAALWFLDGLHGKAISYPQTPTELLCYRLTSSHKVLTILTTMILAQMSFPLFYGTYCPWTEAMHPNYNHYSSDLQSLFSVLDVVFLLFYFADAAATLKITQSRRKRHSKDIWLIVRICCCGLFFVWSIINAATGSPLDFARCLAPIILISRRKSLRLIMLGVFRAARKCIPVFAFLFSIILFWSFLGFLVFRNVENANVQRFSSFSNSLRTCMMSFTAAQYHVFAADPFIDLNPLSSFFFVVLVMTSSILTAPIIISVGNREYRKYADLVFRRQLANRKEAIMAIHCALSSLSAEKCPEMASSAGVACAPVEKAGLVSRSVWLSFCHSVTTAHPINSIVVNLLFDMELDRQAAHTSDVRDDNGGRLEGVNCESLFRMCALLDTRFNVDAAALGDALAFADEDMQRSDEDGSEREQGDEGRGRTWKRWSCGTEETRSLSAPVHSSPPPAEILARHASSSTFGDDMSCSSFSNPMHEPRKQSQTPEPQTSRNDIAQSVCACLQQMWQEFALWSHKIYLHVRMHLKRVRRGVQQVVKLQLECKTIPILLPNGCKVLVIDIIDGAALIVVVAFLLAISDPGRTGRGWFTIGYLLLSWFWIKMLLLGASLGFHKYLKATLGVPVIVNTMSLVFMIMVDVETQTSGRDLLSAPFICLLIVHCTRLIASFSFLSETANVTAVAPLFFRVIFIIFCCIYMFGIFAHNRFCNMLRPEEAIGNDDVAPKWIPFDQQLNFDTFARSLYTMFEIATYGDWSVVQVAAKVSPVASYFFFYTYRFLMTLTILPILSSFIIQAFVTRSNSSKKEVQGSEDDDDDKQEGDDVGAGALKRQSRLGSSRSSRPSSVSQIPRVRADNDFVDVVKNDSCACAVELATIPADGKSSVNELPGVGEGQSIRRVYLDVAEDQADRADAAKRDSQTSGSPQHITTSACMLSCQAHAASEPAYVTDIVATDTNAQSKCSSISTEQRRKGSSFDDTLANPFPERNTLCNAPTKGSAHSNGECNAIADWMASGYCLHCRHLYHLH